MTSPENNSSPDGTWLAEALRYAAAGVVNTVVGYGTFLVAYQLLGFAPLPSNVLAYAVGLTSAFTLNRLFVFGARGAAHRQVAPFLVCFAVAYAANLLVLEGLIRAVSLDPRIAQLFAMVTYTVLFYLLNKRIVFSS